MEKKNLNQSGMLNCVCRSSVCIEAAREDLKKKTDGRAMGRQSPN